MPDMVYIVANGYLPRGMLTSVRINCPLLNYRSALGNYINSLHVWRDLNRWWRDPTAQIASHQHFMFWPPKVFKIMFRPEGKMTKMLWMQNLHSKPNLIGLKFLRFYIHYNKRREDQFFLSKFSNIVLKA